MDFKRSCRVAKQMIGCSDDRDFTIRVRLDLWEVICVEIDKEYLAVKSKTC